MNVKVIDFILKHGVAVCAVINAMIAGICFYMGYLFEKIHRKENQGHMRSRKKSNKVWKYLYNFLGVLAILIGVYLLLM